VINELTAEQQAHGVEVQREKSTGESTLKTVFPPYQQWRAEGGLRSEATSRVLKGEAQRFSNYCKDSVIFNTPISDLDDTMAIEFLKQLKKDGVKFNPRDEIKKTLSQMSSFLRDEKLRHGGLLFQKLKVTKTKSERQADKRKKYRYYHPTKEIPVIFRTLHRLVEEGEPDTQEQFDAASTLYFGAFRNVDVKGDSQPEVGGLRWENIEWEPFKITYWNTKGGNDGGQWDYKHPHPDLKPILAARWERQGRPSCGLVFFDPDTGKNLKKDHDWDLDRIIHKVAGITKQRGRKIHAFRHSAAVAAASGAWGRKWTKDEVAKLLNDTSDAVQIYFDIVDESLQELSSGATSQLGVWGLTIDAEIPDAPPHVAGKPAISESPTLGGVSADFG
jgi:integrase